MDRIQLYGSGGRRLRCAAGGFANPGLDVSVNLPRRGSSATSQPSALHRTALLAPMWASVRQPSRQTPARGTLERRGAQERRQPSIWIGRRSLIAGCLFAPPPARQGSSASSPPVARQGRRVGKSSAASRHAAPHHLLPPPRSDRPPPRQYLEPSPPIAPCRTTDLSPPPPPSPSPSPSQPVSEFPAPPDRIDHGFPR
jgi:hypothetical protein